MGEHLLQGSVFLQQLHRGFIPHARHPGNVVAAVSGQALPVRDLGGGESVFLHHLFRGEADGFGDALAGKHQLCAASDQLQRIPVPGQEQRGNTRFRSPETQRSQQIVRLPSLQGEAGDAHVVQQGPDRGKLLNQLGRRGAAAGLVFGIDGMAEGGAVLVKADRQIPGFFLPDYLQQHIQKPVNCVGVNPVRVHQGQGVKSPVNQAVSIHNQKDFLHDVLHRLCVFVRTDYTGFARQNQSEA